MMNVKSQLFACNFPQTDVKTIPPFVFKVYNRRKKACVNENTWHLTINTCLFFNIFSFVFMPLCLLLTFVLKFLNRIVSILLSEAVVWNLIWNTELLRKFLDTKSWIWYLRYRFIMNTNATVGNRGNGINSKRKEKNRLFLHRNS